ncbi:MAG TPA: sulfite oxidase [Acidimicrobiales bacterium]|nr:sulfite oxidase [Acidimicrobiales bacterium]
MEQRDQPVYGEAGRLTAEELQLATRNHGLPLEALRYPLTPAGLHYLLIHYDIPAIDTASFVVDIGGRVSRPCRLTLDELRARPKTTVAVTMECAGNGRALLEPRPLSQPWLHEAVGTAQWSGVSLAVLLDEVGVNADAVEVVFTGADRGLEGGVEQAYERALPLGEARRPEVIVAFEMNGEPLLPQHGAPLRLITPGWYGMTNVKWLSRMTLVSEPFAGYQQDRSYRLRRDPSDAGTPLSRIEPRALMIPPGVPDFFTRRRVITMAPCALTGRAWSGWGPMNIVEVSVDGGATWSAAELLPSELGPWAWQSWTFEWTPTSPGEYVLCCRARDAAGHSQAENLTWNVGGYANPAPQRVVVTVQS